MGLLDKWFMGDHGGGRHGRSDHHRCAGSDGKPALAGSRRPGDALYELWSGKHHDGPVLPAVRSFAGSGCVHPVRGAAVTRCPVLCRMWQTGGLNELKPRDFADEAGSDRVLTPVANFQ